MSPLAPSRNVAARMGRWSASHKKTAILGWLAFVIAAFMIGNAVGTKNIDPNDSGSGESGRVDRLLNEEFKQAPGDSVVIQSKTLTADDPAFRNAVDDVAYTVANLKNVTKVDSPYETGNQGQISKDRHTALVNLRLKYTDDDAVAKELDKPVEAAIVAADKRYPAIDIEEYGVNVNTQIDDAVAKDFQKAGVFSLPVTLGVLIVAFGALIAAGLPVLLALSAVFGTLGLLALPSQLVPVDQDVAVIVLLIGLAVGVDYSMFYLKRAREERRAGRSERGALEAAAATSGRAVLISGLTVMIAMGGMLFTGDKSFASFGIATMLVVAVAVLGSLTVLPATLAALGDKVEKARVPFLHRLRREDGEGRFWGAIVDRVLRRPVLSVAVAAGLLLALAAPALHMHTAMPGVDTYPQNLSAVKTYNKLEKAFPGDQIPATVVIETDDVNRPAVQSAIAELEHKAAASGQFIDNPSVDYNRHGTVATVNLPIQGTGTDSKSEAALATLREDIVPATVGKIPGAEVGVTGMTAQSKDFNDQMKHAAPFVFAFVLGFAFILLLMTFRSIVIAIKAVVLNLLSVAASYGAVVLVFQYGWGKGLLGFEYTGGVMSFLPIFLFVILFGLSMDYHVFILSRVREAYDRGMSTDDAVSHGIKSTAGVVTSAAIVMVGVFSIFATLQFLFLKQFGVGLAVAVLIDATIVRAVLLPATMKLLGDWNWYLPRWLDWLPHVKHETAPEPAAA
jgi:RND superfamily putative drug exporter